MTEWIITEYCKKVVHLNVEDAVKYFLWGIAAMKRGDMCSKGCLLMNQYLHRATLLCNLFLYVAGAAGSMYSGQNAPAAPLA